MRRSSGSDNLAHSFTDLMTSLMVIFILLLLVFLNNRASVNTAVTRSLLDEMKKKLEPAGFTNIALDPNDPYTIVVPVSGEKLTFLSNASALKPEGEAFLREMMPKLAAVVCADTYRSSVDTVIVEGHSDSAPYRGISVAESQALNLKLSQDRAMEVVQKSLISLSGAPGERGCLLEKLSANGRGEQDLEATADKSRRVVLKIRVNSVHGLELMRALSAKREAPRFSPAFPSPAAAEAADVLSRLQSVPRQHVAFRLSEDAINDYMVFALARTPRPGIESVHVKIFPHNYISTVSEIDLDAIQQRLPFGVATLFGAVLTGKATVWVDYRFQVRDGQATFVVEKAYYGTKSLSPAWVSKLIQALGSLQPERFDTERPVPLPFGLREAATDTGVIAGTN